MEEVRRRRSREEREGIEKNQRKREDENDEERRGHPEKYVEEEGVQSASTMCVHLYNVHTYMPYLCTYFIIYVNYWTIM